MTPDADALTVGRAERLHLAVVHVDVDVAGANDVGLDLFARRRPTRDPFCDARAGQSPAVPPKVMPLTRSVGWPMPTGTP